ncbi:rhomboid family intramembrane serine protease [Lysinibacillus sp. ZYM-1]|uniref:rhomboid family intramembrane serine protease n=1 Tax=Lysinibacillus sp. ZYM-1 TaxID=1681184 RepID=UPI0006CE6FCE|nr:rhomboid family intramembrane serine protease [Lysinibacillus sp. ZYM-1]KPN95774.1 Rhomboid protease gluP [Lysinibacillus sp. ZYM-1]
MFSRTENFKQYTKYYPIVSTLIAINLILYVLSLLPGVGTLLWNYGIQANFLIQNGEWWRVFSAMFLHAGFMHMFFNMFSLYLFGPELEKIAGKARFITIYLVSGIVGNMATYIFYNSNYTSLGASGAIFGIFGAFGALVYYTRRTMPMLRKLILPIIVISVIMTFLQPNVNVNAHLGGLVTGFILGLIYLHPKRILSWRKQKMAGKS